MALETDIVSALSAMVSALEAVEAEIRNPLAIIALGARYPWLSAGGRDSSKPIG